MPAGDRTGPRGMGSMTGRGMGYCGGYDAPGWANWGPGHRFYRRGGRGVRGGRWGGYGTPPARMGGRRSGGGWGWRHPYHDTGLPPWGAYDAAYGAPDAPQSREQEVEMLKDEAEWLKEQLNAINQRMDELSQE